jgi:hypothetical protein
MSLGAERVAFLKLRELFRVHVWKPSVSYLIRRTSRAGFAFMSGGVISIAQPNMEERYLRRLLAAPGLSFLRSRRALTGLGCQDVKRAESDGVRVATLCSL